MYDDIERPESEYKGWDKMRDGQSNGFANS